MENSELNNIDWDNTHIYKDFSDPKLLSDMETLKNNIYELESLGKFFSQKLKEDENENNHEAETLSKAVDFTTLKLKTDTSLMTISTFAHCQLSTDSQHEQAKELSGKVSILFNQFNKAVKPLDVYLQRASSEFIHSFLEQESVKEVEFQVRHSRKMAPHLLSLSEEVLAKGLSQDGLHAWGKLYSSLSGGLKVQMDQETLGVAEASGILRQGDRAKRKLAWEGINKAWQEQEESVAAILNSINGWRLEMNKNRSHEKDLHYLDVSCHDSRITRQTLSTLMETTHKYKHIGQKALKRMAELMGVEKLEPYDILAPYPEKNNSGRLIPFDEAINLISEAFSTFDPKMGEFAQMMYKNNWIDSRPTPNRAPGAYCTKFASVREPRVFMTYQGSMGNVITLAHELGHAYHNWVMKDLPLSESRYSMTLAETASIFAETLVKNHLLLKSDDEEAKKKIIWQDAQSATSLLLNIPARFEFEKAMVEARKSKPQTPSEMKKLMKNAWEKWYGDSLGSYDEMFWASKLHFSISQIGFYNYPYLFGYLFSLGIYSQKEAMGSDFSNKYQQILRDTGTMTAEDLIKKHLDRDIEKPAFWEESLALVESQVGTL